MSEAMLVPAEKVDKRRPPLERLDRWLIALLARELQPPIELSMATMNKF